MRPAENQNRPAEAIEDLARRVARLTVSRLDPEAFFEERSEIANDMRRVADALRTGRRAKAS